MSALPLISLLARSYAAPGELLELTSHEHADGAILHRYVVDAGHVLVTTWRDQVHEVVYQTPCMTSAMSEERNRRLFAFYGDGQSWNELLDNGFGKTFRRADLQRFALWSYAMDFTTFGTMAFHEVKWR